MNETLITAKAALVTALSALSVFLGWKGVMFCLWWLVMAIDWITGTAAAKKSGTWASSISRDGAYHKFGTIVVVCVTLVADVIIMVICDHLPLGLEWPGLLFPLVLAWYIVTEIGSILENAIKLGANLPSWLAKGLKITLKAIEEVGEAAVDGLEHAEHVVEIAEKADDDKEE